MSERMYHECEEGNIQQEGNAGEETDPLLQPRVTSDVETKTSLKSRVCGWNWKNLLTVVCLWLTYLICSMAYSIIAPFFPDEAENNKGCTPILTGVILSSSALCVTILSPIFGYFLTHLGVRFTISSGLLLIGGSFVLLGFVDMLSPGLVFITFCILLRMVEGVGSAMFITATFTVLPVLFPKSVGTITGFFEVAGGLGFALGPPLGGLLFQLGGFRLPFITVGVSVLLFILPCTLLVEEKGFSKKQGTSFKLLFRVFTSVPLIVVVMANTLILVAISFFSPTLEPFLTEEFDLNSLEVGLVFLAEPGTYMIAAMVIGPLSDRLGRRRSFIVFGLFLFGIACIFIGPADFVGQPRLWLTCLAFGVAGVASAFGMIPIFADMLVIAKCELWRGDENCMPALTAVVSGVVSSSLSFGEFLGPLIGGALTEVFPFTTSMLLLGEVILAEALLLLGVTVITKKH